MKVSNLRTATVIALVLQAITGNTLRSLENWTIDAPLNHDSFFVENACKRLDALHAKLSRGEALDAQAIDEAYPGTLKLTRPDGVKTYSVSDFVQTYLSKPTDPLHVGNRIYSRLASALHCSFADFGMPGSLLLAQAFRNEDSERSIATLSKMGSALRTASVDDPDFVQHLFEVVKAIQKERANADGRTPLDGPALDEFKSEEQRMAFETWYYMRFCRYSLKTFADSICVLLPVLMLACGDTCRNTKEVLHAMHLSEVVAEFCNKARAKISDCGVRGIAEAMAKAPWDYFYGFIDCDDEAIFDHLAMALKVSFATEENVIISVSSIMSELSDD